MRIPDRLPWEPRPEVPQHTAPPAGFAWHEFSGPRYGLAALEREAAAVRGTLPGGRNDQLNRSAFAIGQLVASGQLDRDLAYRTLFEAGVAAGLSETEVRRTIASGFSGGAAKPRTQPPGRLLVPVGANHAPNHAEITPSTGGPEDDGLGWRFAPGGSFVLDVPPLPPAVWGAGQQVAWAQGEALMLCGPAGVGKTTLAVQLVAARLGIGQEEVLGLPVRPGAKRVLYLAMDRPPQIARAMGRLFTEDDRRALDEKLIVWPGPPPYDMAKRPETLAALCDRAKADTVIVDSLKDSAVKLSDDEVGGGYNRARQKALVEGVEVLELHHQRKAGGDNKRPTKLDDVYGSTWLTAGAGSVLLLWGEPGDPVVELHHLKQPAEQLGPWMVLHDHERGRSWIDPQPDVLTLVRNQRQVGMTPTLLAKTLYHTDKPSRSEVERARRRLNQLEREGLLTSIPGERGGAEARYYPADHTREVA